MILKEANNKSVHAALISHEDDKLKELLLELKFVLKDGNGDLSETKGLKETFDLSDEDVSPILKHEDVKVRQFGSYCIACLFGDTAVEELTQAYLNEKVEYNKEHLLKALSLLDCSSGSEKLYDRLNELVKKLCKPIDESYKHYIKEVRSLLGLLHGCYGRRSFTGTKTKSEIILTTNRNYREITLKQIKGFPKKLFNAGVMVMCDDIDQIKKIRTYDEMLFAPPFDEERYGTVATDDESAGQYIKEVLTPYILERMLIRKGEKNLPVAFRVDIKGEQVQEKEAFLQKRLGELIEKYSDHSLINIRNDFDIQIRFVTRKTGVLKPLVKFYVPKDLRFSYKTQDIAAGLKPYLAALICNLCGEYMNEAAKVIDPFCGAGTLLVEREKYMSTEFLFGSDIYPAACECAEKNLFKAGLYEKSKIINKDFCSLEHKEPFNELITDLPFETEKKTVKELENVYGVFFDRSRKLLENGSYLFVYTRNSTLFKKQISKYKVTLIKCHEISKHEGAYLYILKI
ncbi:MAG: methyltransferase [Lachnospiraceae bacterium]|nr:methyltransferase [Lachnospiraceae bacterium]